MKDLTTYLFFDGTCGQAMKHYEKCLGGELHIMTFGEAKTTIPGAKDRVMHAKLINGSAALMASDTHPGEPLERGDNFSVSINCDSQQELDRLYAALGEGGNPKMKPADTFWGAYFGMLTDRFGVNWMLNFDKPK